jgi:hypothetical protein
VPEIGHANWIAATFIRRESPLKAQILAEACPIISAQTEVTGHTPNKGLVHSIPAHRRKFCVIKLKRSIHPSILNVSAGSRMGIALRRSGHRTPKPKS